MITQQRMTELALEFGWDLWVTETFGAYSVMEFPIERRADHTCNVTSGKTNTYPRTFEQAASEARLICAEQKLQAAGGRQWGTLKPLVRLT